MPHSFQLSGAALHSAQVVLLEADHPEQRHALILHANKAYVKND